MKTFIKLLGVLLVFVTAIHARAYPIGYTVSGTARIEGGTATVGFNMGFSTSSTGNSSNQQISGTIQVTGVAGTFTGQGNASVGSFYADWWTSDYYVQCKRESNPPSPHSTDMVTPPL